MNFHSPMKSISPNAMILSPKPQVQQTLDLKYTQLKIKNSIRWFFINGMLLSLLIIDIFYGGSMYKPFYWIEWCLVFILSLNSLYHMVMYIIGIINLRPVIINPEQKRLLGISDDDSMFKMSVPLSIKPMESISPLNISCINLGRRSLNSTGVNDTKNYLLSPFCKFSSPKSSNTSNSPNTTSPNPPGNNTTSPTKNLENNSFNSTNNSLNKSLNCSMNRSLTGEGLILTEVELQNYLKDVSDTERKTIHLTNVDQPSNLLSSFWSHSSTRNPNEISPMLRRCSYQLAPTIDKIKSSPGTEEGTSPRGYFSGADVWRKYRIDSLKVNQWTANLRMWISKTVVERVAAEIDNVSQGLVRHGLSDAQPGNVGLDRLRKLAQSTFVVAGVPTLPALLPFLELSNNQDYLIKRIKILAKGGSMSEFKWCSGGSYNGKPWDNSLPTDTAIIMHLFSSYMDTQLEAPLDQPDARTFTSRYMAKSGSNLPRTKGPIIVCQSTNPPYYCLALSGDSQPSNFEEIPRGRNNMFHTLLLFLYIIKTQDHGMLGRVNLGMSGVNLLWVIEN